MIEYLYNAVITASFPFSAVTLLVGRHEEHSACKKDGLWFVGGDDLSGDLHIL